MLFTGYEHIEYVY